MRIFLIKITLLIALCALVAAGIIGVKLWRFNRNDLLENGPVVKPDDQILFVGSSSIGCAITPRADDHMSVFWRWKLQPQYFLIELEKLEREHALKNLKAVVVEFGFQNFAYQTISDMTSSRVETLPLAWGNLSRFPLKPASMFFSVFDCIRFGYRTRVTSRPDPGVSIAERTDDWKRTALAGLARSYFDIVKTTDLMCDDWVESLKKTYDGIFNLCQKNELRPLILLTPMPKCFRDITPPDMKMIYDEFTEHFKHVGFEVVDGSSIMDEKSFMDLTHLSCAGSKRFTEWFMLKVGR